MITIPNYQSSLTPFTLLEKTTFPLSAATYILQLNGKELHDETLLFLTGDTSANINRYNYFPINLTPYNLIKNSTAVCFLLFSIFNFQYLNYMKLVFLLFHL
jgi:hypothetical protein